MAIEKKKSIFLLGGRDLEMETIKELLLQEGFVEGEDLFDRDLSWGAKLSVYRDIVEANADKEVTLYGIELEEDIAPPANYRHIDHHNEKSGEPTSLEQILTLLGLEDRLDSETQHYYALVSANDKSHIEGLKCMGASEEEIEKIRRKDRMAQGVTEEEERFSEKEMNDLKQEGDLFVVKTTRKKLSPLSDRLLMQEKKPLIVYNDEALIYYGNGIERLIELFKEGIEASLVYYGGDPLGYMGFTKEYVTKERAETIIQKIVESKRDEEWYSYHTFLLPFSYEKLDLDEQHWRYLPFKIESSRDYNEFIYFYKFAQEVLYNEPDKASETIAKYYEFEEQEGSFIIDTTKGSYRLELDGISIRVFEASKVAILGFNLINRRYRCPKDILVINDFGRRIYPQFIDNAKKFDLGITKNNFLPTKVTIAFKSGKAVEEDFGRFEEEETYTRVEEALLPCYVSYLIGENFEKIEPIIDDRMYLISIYLNDTLPDKMKAYDENKGYAYEEDAFWYEYLFVDGNGKTCQSRPMTKKLIQKSTYDRWVEWGTLFGISRYSFVALTGSEYGKKILIYHMQTIYFQMFTLLLAYRAMILHFSKEVTKVLDNKNPEERKEDAEKLFKEYLVFKNNIYFQEVTAQEQGIELFDIAREQMKLDHYLHELDHDIDELHNFIQMKIEDERNEQGLLLNRLAGVFLPPSLLSGIFGVNIIDFVQDDRSMGMGFGFMLLSALLGYGFVSVKRSALKFILAGLLVAVFAWAFVGMPTKHTPDEQIQTIQKGDRTPTKTEEEKCQSTK